MDWAPILIAAIASTPGIGALFIQARKLVPTQTDILAARSKAAKAEADAAAIEAQTIERYQAIARTAAEDVLNRSQRITTLELTSNEMRDQITALQSENRGLRAENGKLEKRVKKLENLLRAHDIPFPQSED